MTPEVMAGSPTRVQWTLDYGASHHMTCRKDLLTDFKPSSGHVSVADGRVVQIKGALPNAPLTSVLYVPNLNCNLISINQCTNKGGRLDFSKTQQP